MACRHACLQIAKHRAASGPVWNMQLQQRVASAAYLAAWMTVRSPMLVKELILMLLRSPLNTAPFQIDTCSTPSHSHGPLPHALLASEPMVALRPIDQRACECAS